jgi:hypothetical protein
MDCHHGRHEDIRLMERDLSPRLSRDRRTNNQVTADICPMYLQGDRLLFGREVGVGDSLDILAQVEMHIAAPFVGRAPRYDTRPYRLVKLVPRDYTEQVAVDLHAPNA